MSRKYPRITFTPSVKATQEHYGARQAGEAVEQWDMDDEHLSDMEAGFVLERDGFYMATVGEDGWPYVQYRGGPPGFLHVLDEQTLAYADFRGNRQYISMGNLSSDDRVSLFLMDYPNRRRMKVLARAELVELADRPELVERLRDESYPGKPERAMLFHLAAFDWNCPQHITPRFSLAEIEGLGLT